MFKDYYEKEINHLRELAVEFSHAHPSLAPMLTGASNDPDVERLLEGSAFLSAMINQRLDDEFPQVIRGLTQLVLPHYLTPRPSSVIMRFEPAKALRERVLVPEGTRIDSTEVDGVRCSFSITRDVILHPVSIIDVKADCLVGEPGFVRIDFEVGGGGLENWPNDTMRLYHAGPYGQASNRLKFLLETVSHIRLRDGRGNSAILDREALLHDCFDEEHALPGHFGASFPGYRLLRDYFILPEKFLFLDVVGLKRALSDFSGSRLEIEFVTDANPSSIPDFDVDSFVLFACPAVNLFDHPAEPISLDHRTLEYRVKPLDNADKALVVHSLKHVRGRPQGGAESKEYKPFGHFNPHGRFTPTYFAHTRPSPLKEDMEIWIQVAYSPEAEEDVREPVRETLSIDLRCCNGARPEMLGYGDISRATDSSPPLARFKNITLPGAYVRPPGNEDILWKLLSHLHLNFLAIADVEKFKTLIGLYIFTDCGDRAKVLSNVKRVEAVREMSVAPSVHMHRGSLLKGLAIDLRVAENAFASRGDFYLFGVLMDHFLAGYAAMNTFTKLTLTESASGEHFTWPTRLGSRQLL